MLKINRRHFLGTSAAAGAALAGGLGRLTEAEAAGLNLPAALPEGVRNYAIMDTLPGKKPLIKLSYRPPNYETPIEYFRTAITPNDVFFVRYHLADIPQVDAQDLEAQGRRRRPRTESLSSLSTISRRLPAGRDRRRQPVLRQPPRPVRSRMSPASNGAMARWAARAGRARGSRTCSTRSGSRRRRSRSCFDGADGPAVDKTPDFVKSIPVWKAMEETTLIAYEMNGQPLPHFNGFPARLVVPGWTGTYWMKHLTSINAVTKPDSAASG